MNILGFSAAHGGVEGAVTASQLSLKHRTHWQFALLMAERQRFRQDVFRTTKIRRRHRGA
jgi:hypothetical protein